MGFAGLLGSGRTETAELLAGVAKPEQGALRMNGREVHFNSPLDAMHHKIAFCPEDRKIQGIIGDLSVRENIIIGLQAKKGMWNHIPLKEQERIADEYIKLLQIKVSSPEQLIRNLSGGNQQKAIIARWLVTQPDLLILDEPTRGMTAIISRETIVIDNPVYTSLASARIYVLPGGFISVGVVIALVTLVAATLVLKFTRFGRNIYALGGNEMSAQLMGLPTKRTKILAYVVCGFCSALAGVVYSLIMLSGYPLHAVSMEMDAIASSVIGGTLMSGGVAFLPGTLLGVLIQGVIQTFITFQGTLSAWWTRIIIALLLCLFIVIQAVVSRSRQRLNSEH